MRIRHPKGQLPYKIGETMPSGGSAPIRRGRLVSGQHRWNRGRTRWSRQDFVDDHWNGERTNHELEQGQDKILHGARLRFEAGPAKRVQLDRYPNRSCKGKVQSHHGLVGLSSSSLIARMIAAATYAAISPVPRCWPTYMGNSSSTLTTWFQDIQSCHSHLSNECIRCRWDRP